MNYMNLNHREFVSPASHKKWYPNQDSSNNFSFRGFVPENINIYILACVCVKLFKILY